MALVITLLVAGLLLLALETVLPGMIAAAAGVVCLLAAIVIAYSELGVTTGNLVLVIIGGALVAGVLIWFRFFPRSRLGQRFVSKGTVGNLKNEQPELLHKTGTALTDLRPSGKALIAGRRVDVVTEGGMVERGSPVRVVAVEGMRVVVRAVES